MNGEPGNELRARRAQQFPHLENYTLTPDHLYETGHKTYEFREITQDNGHYAVQGHRFWYKSKAHMRLPISD